MKHAIRQRKFWQVGMLAAVSLVLLSAGHGTVSSAQTDGPQIWGAWYFTFAPLPGVTLPAIGIINRDGTFTNIDANDFAMPPFPNLHSATHGSWVRKENGVFESVGYYLVFDTTGTLVGIGRNLLTSQFNADLTQLNGTVTSQLLACPTPFTCPDPLAADAAWVPDPAAPFPIPFVGKRIRGSLP